LLQHLSPLLHRQRKAHDPPFHSGGKATTVLRTGRMLTLHPFLGVVKRGCR
jgi:hypothetical protein